MTDTFNFPYHMVKTQYPKTGSSLQFGGSYEFTAKPNSPTQRTFILTFASMKYFLNEDGTLDESVNPNYNYRKFQMFYEAHELWDTFIYPHPHLLANINVKFAQPLADPDGIIEGGGAVSQFEVQLREQP